MCMVYACIRVLTLSKIPKRSKISFPPYRIDPTAGLELDATLPLLSTGVALKAAGGEKKKKGSWLGVFSLLVMCR